jgi:hypothetical protein
MQSRKLRQLYDQRLVDMEPPHEPAYRSPTKFDGMPWTNCGQLTKHGRVPRLT